jgi:hypothetical protein
MPAGTRRPARSRTTVAIAVTALAATVLLAACTGDAPRSLPGGPRTGSQVGTGARADVAALSLVREASCEDLVAATRRAVLDGVAAREADQRSFDVQADGAPAPTSTATPDAPTSDSADGSGSAGATARAAAPAAGAEARADAGPGSVVAGTNDQERGVDESDLVKTDGRLLVVVEDGVLRVVVLDGSPAVDGSLPLAGLDPKGTPGALLSRGQLFLRGREAVVVGAGPGDAGTPDTVVVRVDLQDPSRPRVIQHTSVDGDVAAARMVDGRIRLVLRSTPVAVNRAISEPLDQAGDSAEELTADDVLPHRTDPDGTVHRLGGCGDVLAVPVASRERGTSTTTVAVPASQVTVLSIGDDLRDLAPVTVAGDVGTVYAAPAALYVTTNAWTGSTSVTVVHRFALDRSGPASYTGTGFVPGTLLDSYSMSDRGGALRVVTTDPGSGPIALPESGSGPAAPSGPPVTTVPADLAAPERSGPAGRLTVLRPDASGTLVPVGRLTDLGVGEQVRSVRFLDDLAYVVTFRRTDPLFAVDLHDTTAPRLLGELHVPGFSEYLHPIGHGRLLGIGSDADPGTGITTGFKASLFDVTDPTAPRQLDSFTLPEVASTVGQDPHAFTWDPVHHQAVVPVQLAGAGFSPVGGRGCGPNEDCAVDGVTDVFRPVGTFSAASLVVTVVGDRLHVQGALTHERGGTTVPIERSVVVDDTVWTVSGAGVGRTPSSAPTTVDLLPF